MFRICLYIFLLVSKLLPHSGQIKERSSCLCLCLSNLVLNSNFALQISHSNNFFSSPLLNSSAATFQLCEGRFPSFFSIRKIGKRGQKPYWTPSCLRAPAAASFENYYYAILVFFMEKKTSFLLVAKQTLFFSQKGLKKTNTEVSGSGEGFLDNFFWLLYARTCLSLAERF